MGRAFGIDLFVHWSFLLIPALAVYANLGLGVTAAIGGAPSGGPFRKEKPPADLNWDMWLGQAPKVDYIKQRCHSHFRWWFEYPGGNLPLEADLAAAEPPRLPFREADRSQPAEQWRCRGRR